MTKSGFLQFVQGSPSKSVSVAKVDFSTRLPISPDCVFDASLAPGTCLHRFVDLKAFIQQVPGEQKKERAGGVGDSTTQ
jgi:hypothetical protein